MAIEITDLNGKLLIAMPDMGDPRFDQSVILICAHSSEGAMGLIVNKPSSDIEFNDLLQQLDIPMAPQERRINVHFGGPVEYGRGFVLHSDDYDTTDSTLRVGDKFSMTATLEILQDIANGAGPKSCFLAMGYAGWGPGQLEDEIQRNGWLITEATEAIVFAPEHADKWCMALNSMGVSPLLLSTEGGSA